ncbi:MAG: class I SAM-dependent methyltransferase [Planctomycetaceae bacterium]|nr:class I SAM-dependent methyltransferase [Planctomycetaceae bacterium]
MHKSSMLRMQWFRDNYCNKLNPNNTITVLDVGSQCVPGQSETYKVFFSEPSFKYIGLDMTEGYNVDIAVKRPYQWDEVPDNFCDILISGQVLEHVEFPWFTIAEMARVVKPHGLICIIAPSMSKLHRFPVHTQNYFSDGLIALAKYAGLNVIHASTNYAPLNAPLEWYSKTGDTILIAQKTENWNPNAFDKVNYVCKPTDLNKIATGLVSLKNQSRFYMFKVTLWKSILKLIPKPIKKMIISIGNF